MIWWVSPPLLPKSPLLLSAQGRWRWPGNAAAFLHWGKVNPKSLQGFHPPLGNFVKGENFASYKLWGLLFLNRNYYKILNRVTVCWSWEHICSDPGLSRLVFCIQTDCWWTPRDEWAYSVISSQYFPILQLIFWPPPMNFQLQDFPSLMWLIWLVVPSASPFQALVQLPYFSRCPIHFHCFLLNLVPTGFGWCPLIFGLEEYFKEVRL